MFSRHNVSRLRLRLGVCVGVICGIGRFELAHGQTASEPAPTGAVYVTPNRSLSDLSLWMSRYYEKLKAGDRLPVQLVTDDVGTSVRSLIFGMGLLRGTAQNPAFPAGMDRLLCSLNERLCKLNAKGVAVWSNKKGDSICLPNVQWMDGFHFARVNVPATPSLTESLERTFGTCSALGERCESVTASYSKNRSADGKMTTVVLAQMVRERLRVEPRVKDCNTAPHGTASEKLGLVKLPFEGGDERLRLGAPQSMFSDQVSAEMMRSQQALEIAVAELRSENRIEYTTGIARPAASTSPQIPAPDAPLGPASPPISTAPPALPSESTNVASVATPIAAESNAPLLDVDSDIFPRMNLLRFRKPSGAQRTVRVYVFDWEINGCHRAFRDAIALKGPCPTVPTSPFTILANPTFADHGAHIAGLIGGAFGLGISPTVKILPVPVLGSGVTRMDGALYQKINDVFLEAPSSARVANFSMDLRPEQASLLDQIGATITGMPSILFVAAAGDEHASLDGACNVMPACAQVGMPEANNLLVVGGASVVGKRWALWPRSRYGKRVDILAPAEEITSAAYLDGTIAHMTGSSQSTAVISGLSARLFQGPLPQGGDWNPAQIKNRLLATARLQSSLASLTRSGVVDGDRALDVGRQVLVARKDGMEVEYRGTLVGVYHRDNFQTSFPFVLPGAGQALDICRVYRLSHREGNWIVAYQPVGTLALGRWAYMKIEFGIELMPSFRSLVFRPEGAANNEIVPIDEVVEFYDKFSGEFACSTVDAPHAPG